MRDMLGGRRSVEYKVRNYLKSKWIWSGRARSERAGRGEEQIGRTRGSCGGGAGVRGGWLFLMDGQGLLKGVGSPTKNVKLEGICLLK